MSNEFKIKTLRELQLTEGFDEQFNREKLIKEGSSGLADILENKWVPLEEAQKELAIVKDEVEMWKKNRDIYVEKKNKLYAQIEAANKILDLADFEDLTGAHKIHWSNWQALREVLKK